MNDTILMVDDNAEMRELFKDLIEESGYKVVTFKNVNEAKAYLSNPENVQNLKTIVSDLLMGPVDGLDFLSYVKSRMDLRHINFFLLTGASVQVFEPFLRPFVINGIIEKPFKTETLIKTICGSGPRESYKQAA